MSTGFKGRSVCHIADLSVEEMTRVLDVAEGFAQDLKAQKPPSRLALGRVLATLFFEPSTRTRLSFESAMSRLGGSVVSVAQPGQTSVAKGETLADTIRMVAAYSDAIVLRHPQEGAARLAARYSKVPIINAGDGAGQHPTQTLLDLYTIRKEKGNLSDVKVALVGDLKYGRTVHSLAHALARLGTEMALVAPEGLQMPADARAGLHDLGARYSTAERLDDVIGDIDVLYMTRIQKERFPDLEEYRRVQNVYQVSNALLARAKKGVIVLHPLPRVGEILPEVDDTPNAKYFDQAANGVPVRMALLALILGLVE